MLLGDLLFWGGLGWGAGIGGGGFAIVYDASTGQTHAFDFRETAPAALDAAAMPIGLDGCSAPNYALPLSRLAHLYARLAQGRPSGLGLSHPRRSRLISRTTDHSRALGWCWLGRG